MKNYINENQIKNKLNKYSDIDINKIMTDINLNIEKMLNQHIREYNKKKENENVFDEAEYIYDVYSNVDELNLPSWIKKEMPNIKVIGNSKKTIILKDGRRYHLDNPLNDLSGSEWTYFINSVINTAYKTSGKDSFAHHIRKIHPTPKPPNLMQEIIEFFTKEDELVFDYFMGVGGTLLGAASANRKAIGIDLNQTYINAYKEATKYLTLTEFPTLCGDSNELLDSKELDELFNGEKANLILLDPPYGNMMSKEKTGADIKKYGNIATPFTNDTNDLGNINDLNLFFERLTLIVEKSLKYLKNKGYIVLFIKDLQPKDKSTNLLHAQLIESLNKIEILKYKGLKIWADQTSKLFPYGYPFSFVSNQIHQYIIIFRKEE